MKKRGCFSWGLIVFVLFFIGNTMQMILLFILAGEKGGDAFVEKYAGVMVLITIAFVCGGVYYIRRRDRIKYEEMIDSYLENLNNETEDEEDEDSIVFEVKGTIYRSKKAISRAEKLKVGESVVLIKEPDNEHDPTAVKVCTLDGYHIGYVPAYLSSEVTNIMSTDEELAKVRFIHYGESAPHIHVIYEKKDAK